MNDVTSSSSFRLAVVMNDAASASEMRRGRLDTRCSILIKLSCSAADVPFLNWHVKREILVDA